MDTAKDFRILIAEDALERVENRIRKWNLPWQINKHRVLEIVRDIKKSLFKIKYSYLPAKILLDSDDLRKLVLKTQELATSIRPPPTIHLDRNQKYILSEIRYALMILSGLPRRIRLGDDNHPEYAVDVVGVEVIRVEKLERSENLYYTRATTGKTALTIVTNLQTIKVGQVRAAAILPPKEFMGVISEAMYSSEPLTRDHIGRRVPRRLLSAELKARIIELAENR